MKLHPFYLYYLHTLHMFLLHLEIIHPQNKSPDLRDNSHVVMNARPDPNFDRNVNWEDADQIHTTIYQWDILDKYWNTV